MKDLAQDGLGCINSAGSNGCANSAVLSEDEFTLDRSGTTLTRRVASIRLLGSGTLRIGFSGGFSDDEVAALAFKVGATTLNFSDDTDTSNGSLFVWTDPALSWSAGDTVAVAIIEMATETTPPSHAGPSHVVAGGDRLVLVFSEALDQATLPVTSAFYSYGANTIRDGVSLTPRRELRALALPSEIMRLPNLEGYLKFPGPLPVASIPQP